MIEKTLVILKPSALQRALIGAVLTRFEQKGLRIAGLKMMEMDKELVETHYAHLADKPFFNRIKDSMMVAPVIVCCLEGVNAVATVRKMTGSTNGRSAEPGTIRGDYSMSVQENIVHTSDSLEVAEIEIKRFFKPYEIFDYRLSTFDYLYANDEY